MAFTTQNIADLGIVFDDAGFHANAVLYIPDPAGPHPVTGGGARPVLIGTHSPHYTGSSDLSTQRKPMTTFCNAGWVGLAFTVRSLQPFNGQTTGGHWPEQSDDFHKVVTYVRTQLATDFPIVGSLLSFVGGTGPSGAASHAMTCTLEGTAGDDRLDFCIACSPATDFANREGNTTSAFISKTAEYADLADTDLVNLRARSPIALITADDKNVMHVNGDSEQMPAHQLLDAADEFALTTNYLAIYNEGALGGQHGFSYWEAIAPQALEFAAGALAVFLGTDPPEPPEPTGRVKVTALITNLAPGLPLTLNVAAHDTLTNLDGPVSQFDFISDRADTGGVGKTAPVGVYAMVDAVEGVIVGDIEARAWHGFAYVDGAVLPTTWKALNPTTRSSYDWSQTDAFMAALFDNNKQGGISVSMGIKNPLWIYSGSHSVSAINVTQPNSGTVPIPWDPNYLGVVKRFIIDMATKYDTHPNLSYIVVGGMGQVLDTILVQAPADYNNLNNLAVAAGYADAIDGWSKTALGILDIWQKAFRTTTCYLAINLPVPSANGGLTGIDEFVRGSIDRYRSRFGLTSLMLDGLTAADSNLSLNSIIRDADRTARAYRFLWPSSDPNCDPGQAPELYDAETGLLAAANAGIAIGAQMEEFYEADILTVTDNYPAHFADFQTDLTNNAV